jgi:transcriptional regulator with XRE-family HTH domain
MGRSDRLKAAREAAGFTSATDAAHSLGIPPPTYLAHENGTVGISSKKAPLYARRFGVSLDWLLEGRGTMRGSSGFEIAIRGTIGAGGLVDRYTAHDIATLAETVTLPQNEAIMALEVRGDSMWPRFIDGEFVLVSTIPRPPGELAGRYAAVETQDGRSMIKLLRHGRSSGLFDLVSHNANIEEDVEVVCAYQYLGTLPGNLRLLSRPKRVTPQK